MRSISDIQAEYDSAVLLVKKLKSEIETQSPGSLVAIQLHCELLRARERVAVLSWVASG